MRGRLAWALGLTAAIAVVLTALITLGLVRGLAVKDALRQLQRDGSALQVELEAIGPAPFHQGTLPAELHVASQLLRASGDHLARVGPRGGVQSNDDTAAAVARAVADRGGGPGSGVVSTPSGSFAYVAIPGRQSGALLVLSRSIGVVRHLLGPIALRVLIAGAIVVIVAVAVSLVIARRLSDRLRHVTDATARVAAGELDVPVPVEGDDEIAGLARRFNEMARSLSEVRRRERDFLASVSHELRTPLTAIRGFADAMADGTASSSEERFQALEVIRSETSRLERLVSDVMDLARLGAQEFRLAPQEVDLAHVLSDAARAHSAAASDAGVALGTSVEGGLVLQTDSERVRQIVSNLVENALRVTPPDGAITIGGRREATGVSLWVADTGPGIAPHDLPHVFERSYLYRVSKGAKPVGSGLGLAIVRELATALGGRIDVASEPGRGATFRLWLPARAPVTV